MLCASVYGSAPGSEVTRRPPGPAAVPSRIACALFARAEPAGCRASSARPSSRRGARRSRCRAAARAAAAPSAPRPASAPRQSPASASTTASGSWPGAAAREDDARDRGGRLDGRRRWRRASCSSSPPPGRPAAGAARGRRRAGRRRRGAGPSAVLGRRVSAARGDAAASARERRERRADGVRRSIGTASVAGRSAPSAGLGFPQRAGFRRCVRARRRVPSGAVRYSAAINDAESPRNVGTGGPRVQGRVVR